MKLLTKIKLSQLLTKERPLSARGSGLSERTKLRKTVNRGKNDVNKNIDALISDNIPEGDGIDVDVDPDDDDFNDSQSQVTTSDGEEDSFSESSGAEEPMEIETSRSGKRKVKTKPRSKYEGDPEFSKFIKGLVKEQYDEDHRKSKGSSKDNVMITPVNRNVQPSIGSGNNNNQGVINQISDFIEGIKIREREKSQDTLRRRREESPAPSCSHQGQQQQLSDNENENSDEAAARAAAENAIVSAEKFKAQIEKPKGKGIEEDDQFFHLTCHIDKALKQKIETGEFVELENLLPKTGANEEGG